MESSYYVIRVTRVADAVLTHARRAQEKEIDQSRRRGGGTAVEVPPPNAWLFQSNPVLYDLRGALRSLNEQVWSVSRYAKEIRTGDHVYLWEAGRRGGIAGLAEIIEPGRLQPEPPEQLPFARDDEAFAGERVRARLRVLRVIAPVIPRRTIVSCPELNALGVLRCSRGTNFRLSRAERTALDSVILNVTT